MSAARLLACRTPDCVGVLTLPADTEHPYCHLCGAVFPVEGQSDVHSSSLVAAARRALEAWDACTWPDNQTAPAALAAAMRELRSWIGEQPAR